jgi:predicted DNA-binding mobile mystery protein A
MTTPAEQLDRRFQQLRPWASLATRPPHGWLKAIRQGLGMTTGQMAKRMKFTQSRVSKMEAAEAHGEITLKSLEKAADALGCNVIYVVMPKQALTETLEQRANFVAVRELAAVEQTMRLEDQTVHDKKYRKDLLREITEKLLRRPSKLWDDI